MHLRKPMLQKFFVLIIPLYSK